jgi:hypothetical protein
LSGITRMAPATLYAAFLPTHNASGIASVRPAGQPAINDERHGPGQSAFLSRFQTAANSPLSLVS